MIPVNCCCDKPTCTYDIAFLITEEKVSVNAPILETPSVSFYIQEFLGFTGASLNNYIEQGPIEGQKENSQLYKEIYETLTGKTFDGLEGCCKDPNYYFLDHTSIKMSEPKYLGTHHKDDKPIFYPGNSNSDGKYLNSLVKQTLILPEKYKNIQPPGLTLFSEIANYSNINKLERDARVKGRLKHAFSKFFKSFSSNRNVYNNCANTVDDEGEESIGYYWNAILTTQPIHKSRKENILVNQPKLKSFYVDNPELFPINDLGTRIGGRDRRDNLKYFGKIKLVDTDYDMSTHGMTFLENPLVGVYSHDRLNTYPPFHNKIPVYFPPSTAPEKNIGYTLSVQYSNNLPVFSGPDEDFLLHYNGLTLGFVNSIAPITYKVDVDQIIKTINLCKKLINIRTISGITLFFKSAEQFTFNKNKISSDIKEYLRYINRADMVTDTEIERAKSRYYRYKNLFKTFITEGSNGYSYYNYWEPKETVNIYPLPHLMKYDLNSEEFCINMVGITYSCLEYPLNELKYVSDFEYENVTDNIAFINRWFNTLYNGDRSVIFDNIFLGYDMSPWTIHHNLAKRNPYTRNVLPTQSRKVTENINDYFHHGIYFDLNKSFQLKKLWETHLSYYWGGASVNDPEPTLSDTEGDEYRFIKYVYPSVSVNKPLCQAKSQPKAWSVYFTVHDDVVPNTDQFEQYFSNNGNSYCKTKTLMSKYQENIRLSIKVLRILKDQTTHQLEGISYSDEEKTKIKLVDTEYTVAENLKLEDDSDIIEQTPGVYDFLTPINEQTETFSESGLIQNQNLKIKENRDTNNVIIFENTVENNSFYDKQQNQINFSSVLNDNITLCPWTVTGEDVKIIVGDSWRMRSGWARGINDLFGSIVDYYPRNSLVDWTHSRAPISRTFSNFYTWDMDSRDAWYYNTIDIRERQKSLAGRELNIPLITGYKGEKTSGKQIVIPYLKITRNSSVTITPTDLSWMNENGITHAPFEKYGPLVFQSENNIDIRDTSAVSLNSYLLYEPLPVSSDYKTGYGVYKGATLSNLQYKNKKETELFNEWKNETINDLIELKRLSENTTRSGWESRPPTLCNCADCDSLISNLRNTTISDKLYFINPICRKNNFNFSVKTEFSGESYIRNYSGLLDNYKTGGVYGPENGVSPYQNKYFTKENVNKMLFAASRTSGSYYSQNVENLRNLLYKNFDIGSRSLNSQLYPINCRVLNTNVETIPLEINLYNNRNQEFYLMDAFYGIWYVPNQAYSNYNYFVNTTAIETDIRKALKLTYNANSMNSNYANISLFKKINSPNYYGLFSDEGIRYPIAQIDGRRNFSSGSDNIMTEYMKQKAKGTISWNNLWYIPQERVNYDEPVPAGCTFWAWDTNLELPKIWYPFNMGGLVLDTDTYKFNYDLTKTKQVEIAFMLWHSDIDFGQFNNEWLNLRNSYVAADNSIRKNGWLITKNQPDQHFIDNLLEKIQEKYVEYQYFEQFINSTIQTIRQLSDFELFCITAGTLNSEEVMGKGLVNVKHFEPRYSPSGNEFVEGNTQLAKQTKFINASDVLPDPTPSTKTPCIFGAGTGWYTMQFYTTANSYDPLRYFTKVSVTGRVGETVVSTPGSLFPKIIRKYYDAYQGNGSWQIKDITNSITLNQTIDSVNIPLDIPPHPTYTSYFTKKITTTRNIVSDTLNWFNVFNRDLRQSLIGELDALLIKRKEPFRILEEIFGTVNITDDIVNEKNLKKISKKISLQNYYSTTRLEKVKSITTNYKILRSIGISYVKYFELRKEPSCYDSNTVVPLNYVYFKDTDFISYKSSDNYWPNIKSVEMYTPDIARVSTNSKADDEVHFLDGLIINQTFKNHNSTNLLENYNKTEDQIKNDPQLLDYNFYRTNGYYLDLSEDYEVYLPQVKMNCKYDALPNYTVYQEDLKIQRNEYLKNCVTGEIISGPEISTFQKAKINHILPKEMIYYRFRYEFDMSAFNPELKIKNTEPTPDVSLLPNWYNDDRLDTTAKRPYYNNQNNKSYYKFELYDDPKKAFFFYDYNPRYITISSTPPMEIKWSKPDQFIIKNFPVNTVKVIKFSDDSKQYTEYGPQVANCLDGQYNTRVCRGLRTVVTYDPVFGPDSCHINGIRGSRLFELPLPAQGQPCVSIPKTLIQTDISYYNLISPYQLFTLDNYNTTAVYDNYIQNLNDKLASGDVFAALCTIKMPTQQTTRLFNNNNINYRENEWSNYQTFIRPKIKVTGIPNTELKLLDFSKFKDKQFINDILYPLYGNFGKK